MRRSRKWEEGVALIKCPECEQDVSSKAKACPHCGCPLSSTAHGHRPVQIIEQTGKGWKAIRAMGWLLIVVGGLVLFAEWRVGNSGGAGVGWWIVLAGVGCVGLGRAGAWWYHG